MTRKQILDRRQRLETKLAKLEAQPASEARSRSIAQVTQWLRKAK